MKMCETLRCGERDLLSNFQKFSVRRIIDSIRSRPGGSDGGEQSPALNDEEALEALVLWAGELCELKSIPVAVFWGILARFSGQFNGRAIMQCTAYEAKCVCPVLMV
jgi:hypothetical protein